MCYRMPALAASLFFLLSASRADDTYTIKINRVEKGGENYQLTLTEKSSHNIVANGADGAVVNEDKDAAEKLIVFEETVLANKAGQRRPDKLALKFSKVQVISNGETKDYGLVGKTVVAELNDKKYQCKLEGGGEFSEPAVKFLSDDILKDDSEVDFKQLALPGKPVAVGETWNCKMKEIVQEVEKKMQGMKMDPDQAKGTAKLAKVYKKDGRTFGQIEITMDLSFAKNVTANGVDFKFKEGSKLKFTVNMDCCIDGSIYEGTTAVTMDFTMKGSLKANGMELTLNGTGSAELKDVRKDVTGK
jgi:hypothetical protein